VTAQAPTPNATAIAMRTDEMRCMSVAPYPRYSLHPSMPMQIGFDQAAIKTEKSPFQTLIS